METSAASVTCWPVKAGRPRAAPLRRTGALPWAGTRWAGLGPGAHVAYQVTGQGQKAKDLVVGKVIKNTPASQQVEVQPYKGVWRQVRVCHLPLFVGPEGETTTTPSNTTLRSIVAYPALTLAVELLRGG